VDVLLEHGVVPVLKSGVSYLVVEFNCPLAFVDGSHTFVLGGRAN